MKILLLGTMRYLGRNQAVWLQADGQDVCCAVRIEANMDAWIIPERLVA